jgi:hypothetical protein
VRWVLAAVLLAACSKDVDPEHACVEAGIAIGARTEECTGDAALGEARVETFEATVTCTVPELADPVQEADLYECALVLRNLACELVDEYGDDLAAWLQTSSCPALTDLP